VTVNKKLGVKPCNYDPLWQFEKSTCAPGSQVQTGCWSGLNVELD
jgi:hypothetical protein